MPETKSYDGTKVTAVPVEPTDIGIDTEEALVKNIVKAAENSVIDMSVLESFLNVSQNRENTYKLIDTMAQDSTLASVLETYTEDSIETNDNGQVVWVESSDADISKYVSFLIDTINVDKHIYNWVYNLIKYGDVYLRLYKESDYDQDPLFNIPDKEEEDEDKKRLTESKESLKEDVLLKVHEKNDHYVHYLEMVANPGEMFELTKFGKTMGYIKAPVRIQTPLQTALDPNLYRYNLNRRDVEVYSPVDFVHACLENNSSRTPEEVNIFLNNDKGTEGANPYRYTVKRGQSLLYNTFRCWRELSLLENAVLLNRITKSSIVRMIQIEVGDMGKEDIRNHLLDIKAMIEQKSALNTGQSMSEYTNPGPIENNIYVPTHNGKGAITPQQIGGDVDVKTLVDLEYFRDKEFASLRAPKQFFGFTDDAAGFNGGSSLSIISSRYGKAIKRVQNTVLQMITDAINLMLLDKGLNSYINKFNLRMVTPVTQEEIDKRENTSNRVRVITDIMNELNDIETKSIKLKILKALISTVVSDEEVINLIEQEIEKVEKEEEESDSVTPKPNPSEPTPSSQKAVDDIRNEVFGNDEEMTTLEPEEEASEEPGEELNLEEPEESPESEEDIYLPSASELGKDLTDNK